MPSVPPDPSDPVAIECRWWDAPQGRYQAGSCAALPNPHPRDHRLAWLEASGSYPGGWAEDVGTAWSIAGPLAVGCTRTVVNCSSAVPSAAALSANLSETLFLDPLDPVHSPSVACPLNSSARLVVFSGSQCQLWRPGNRFACAWNVSAQTFQGSGCAVAPYASCACLRLGGDFKAVTVSRAAVQARIGTVTVEVPIAALWKLR